MRCGFLLFPDLTQLDLTGPYEVLPRAGIEAVLVARDRAPVASQWGLRLLPDAVFGDCPPLDLLVVPGGYGVDAAMEDPATLAFVRDSAASAHQVLSVCTGALLLGAAGLLRGRRATTHWAFRPLLSAFGATPSDERVVHDGRFVSAAGVSAGIDAALALVADVLGARRAQEVQLAMEYAPDPPFDAGRPDLVRPEVEDGVRARYQPAVARTAEVCARAAARLQPGG